MTDRIASSASAVPHDEEQGQGEQPDRYRSTPHVESHLALKPISTNPEENSQMLDAQLRQLGLYAAHTIGDGNCLFRALSDQLYGTPSSHPKLRQDICDWIEAHKERYAPFVEDERGLEHHLSCMRQPGMSLEPSAAAQHFDKTHSDIRRPPRTLRFCAHDEAECQGHSTWSRVRHRVGCWGRLRGRACGGRDVSVGG